MKKIIIVLAAVPILLLLLFSQFSCVNPITNNKWRETKITSCCIRDGHLYFILEVEYRYTNRLIIEIQSHQYNEKTEIYEGRINLKDFSVSTSLKLTFYDQKFHTTCLLNNPEYYIDYINVDKSNLIRVSDGKIVQSWNGWQLLDDHKNFLIINNKTPPHLLIKIDDYTKSVELPEIINPVHFTMNTTIASDKSGNCFFLMENDSTYAIYDSSGRALKEFKNLETRAEFFSICNNQFLFVLGKNAAPAGSNTFFTIPSDNDKHISSPITIEPCGYDMRKRIVENNGNIYILTIKYDGLHGEYDRFNGNKTSAKLLIWHYLNNKSKTQDLSISI